MSMIVRAQRPSDRTAAKTRVRSTGNTESATYTEKHPSELALPMTLEADCPGKRQTMTGPAPVLCPVSPQTDWACPSLVGWTLVSLYAV